MTQSQGVGVHPHSSMQTTNGAMAKTVLIVEDNELNMKLFRDLLEAHGYATLQTRNGIEALSLARAQGKALPCRSAFAGSYSRGRRADHETTSCSAHCPRRSERFWPSAGAQTIRSSMMVDLATIRHGAEKWPIPLVRHGFHRKSPNQKLREGPKITGIDDFF